MIRSLARWPACPTARPPRARPIPELAIAWVDCEVRHDLNCGSHTLFVGEVVDAGFAEGGEDAPVLRMEDTRMSYGG